MTRRDGRFQQADRGTLFLDEIGEISPAVQVKLLRFPARARVRAGRRQPDDQGRCPRHHRDASQPAGAGQAGLFREDLYYRLNVVTIDVPALRQRTSDIGLLTHHFLSRYAKENGPINGITDDAMEKLLRYPGPATCAS